MHIQDLIQQCIFLTHFRWVRKASYLSSSLLHSIGIIIKQVFARSETFLWER